MSKEGQYIFVFITSVFISSVSQIILKKSANITYSNRLQEYLNYRVILAYIMFFGSTLLTIMAYRYIPLALGPILETTGYFFVCILGLIFLKERFNIKKFFGILIIILGIIVFSI